MKLKDKILNRLADSLKKYSSKDFDYITSCEISGKVKGIFFTTDCTTVKELKDKTYDGLINVNDILEEEFKNSEYNHKEIVFCDNDKVVCIYNSKNNSYYEDVHECFTKAEKRLYIKCTDKSYNAFKEYINQSSKYHNYILYKKEIPYKKAFSKVFKEEEQMKEQNNTTTSGRKEIKMYDNYVQITGKLSNIGKEFIKKDGEKARFIDIKQEYEYNGKIKYNKISVMLSNELINDILNMSKNDTISIKGKLHSYVDKDNNPKTVINCTDIDILEISKNQNEKTK